MKYYGIAELDIIDASWIPEYVKNVTALVESCGGKYLARTSAIQTLEGERKTRQMMVIIEFPSKDAAETFYNSKEYRPYREARIAGAKGELMLVAGEDVAKKAHNSAS